METYQSSNVVSCRRHLGSTWSVIVPGAVVTETVSTLISGDMVYAALVVVGERERERIVAVERRDHDECIMLCVGGMSPELAAGNVGCFLCLDWHGKSQRE